MKKRWKFLYLIMLALILLYAYEQNPLTVDDILSWQPENLLLAALILLLVFAAKSALVFIPIMLPQIAAGHLYSPGLAFLINLLGLVVVMTVPYWIGRRLGREKMEQLLQKYPKIQGLLKAQDDNRMAFCFMLRACAVPPADIVTMYLGATGMPFSTNVIGGVLGCLPYMVLTSVLGANIRDPQSPAFWQALIRNVLWVVLSGRGFYLYKKNQFKKEEAD